MSDPALSVREPRGEVRAIALVLHGGRSRSTAPVQGRQLAVLRMRPFATSLRRAGAGNGLAVATLRYQVRGWNGSAESPVHDVRWSLDRLAERFPGAGVGLIGHSMGGRAAVYAAGHSSVRSVVGLAPWIEAGDPDTQLTGRDLLFVHGDRDRMTRPDASAAFARRARRVAARAGYVTVRGEGHAMLGRARLWHELATGYTLAVLCALPPAGTVGQQAANVLTKSLAGEPTLAV